MLKLSIDFDGLDSFEFKYSALPHKSIPDWSRLDNFPCPGNSNYGPNIPYCRLSVDIKELIEYFSNISSITEGKLRITLSDNTEIIVKQEAQMLFFKALWHILLTSNCSVFKYSQYSRAHYLPTSKPNKMLYVFFSIFLIENYSVNTDSKVDIRVFKAEMQIIKDVLNNLLERVRRGFNLKSDSVENGLTSFSNLITLFDMEFEALFDDLKTNIKSNSLMEKYELSELIQKDSYGEVYYKLKEIISGQS